MARILGLDWDGVRGTIQPPKPIVETYTRFGDNRIWVQGIKREATASSLVAWVALSSMELAKTYMDLSTDNIGKRNQIILDDGIVYDSCYVTDISFRLLGTIPKIILEASITCIVDERTGPPDVWLSINEQFPGNLA